ncbi:hypothetical protein C5Z25_10830 [Lactobacillus sp. CBA3605]|uniref:AAA family ATPase n=1 Tax=Lactobacillus sp. CBA3605 TaxID=2099788 RepID=UPI000CFB9F55|nr:AAA family ATPase [Lactobacillus sp. CBA3605]AVK62236.1 hypothetical protein C5Z25_10830 [Lactobacillus sp. CBA3605]
MNSIKQAIRQINAGISRISGDKKTITFVSTSDNIAQQTLMVNMGLMYAYANEKVIIVDTDFDSDRMKDTFKIRSEFGLSNFLDSQISDFSKVIQNISGQSVDIIPSGSLLESDTDYLIADPKFNALISYLAENYDRVLINTPNFKQIDSLDSLINTSDGFVLTISSGNTQKRVVYNILKALRKHNAKLFGYVEVKKG